MNRNNFDFPPASDPNTAIGSTQARFDDLSRNLQRGREEFNSQREAAAAERQTTRQTLSPQTARRRRIASSRGRLGLTEPRLPRYSPPSYPRPPELPRLRRQESRENLRRQLDDLDLVSQELRDARRRLDSASSDLNDAHRSVVVDHMFLRQRKRRKLDHDSIKPTGFHSKPYGYYGQVEPGLLRMEIVSCDGGDYPRDSMALYRAENVLRNDRSVYCTRAAQCNLLLRHQDGIVFTIKKITIKAPEHGFTAPLQQGLIFIGYDADELIKGAEPYRIQYQDVSPPRPRLPSRSPTPSSSRDRESLTLLESLNDVDISRRLIRARPLGTGRRSHGLPSMREMMEYLDLPLSSERDLDVPRRPDDDNGDEACDWPALDPEQSNTGNNGVTRAPTPPPFTVTAVTEDESDGEIGDDSYGIHDNLPPPPPLPWDDIRRIPEGRSIRRPLLADYTDNSSDDETRWASALLDEPPPRRSTRPPATLFARPVRRSTPGRIEPPPPPPVRGSVVNEAKDEENILAPHAKFFIGRQKSRISIIFDTEVSGRFLLFKFFTPLLKAQPAEDNIDIQYVAAHGFAGPRFFPSIDMQA